MKLLTYCVVFWPATVIYAQQCRISGQVFFADVADHAITIKTDAGDLVIFNYDRSTKFLNGQAQVAPEELNNGDRLCVGTSAPVVVAVTSRRQIDTEQQKDVTDWQADSIYGVVSNLDPNTRRITLSVPSGPSTNSYAVDVRPNADYWSFPPNTIRLRDAVPGSFDGIHTGDTLYVRGTKGNQKLTASLIVSGGFRSFAATIEKMEILNELLHVRLVLSGNKEIVHIGQGELYAIAGASGDQTRRLHEISAGDLQPGDTVLILGIKGDQDSVRACALITGFSPGGLPPDPNQQMRWIFDNVRLGEKR